MSRVVRALVALPPAATQPVLRIAFVAGVELAAFVSTRFFLSDAQLVLIRTGLAGKHGVELIAAYESNGKNHCQTSFHISPLENVSLLGPKEECKEPEFQGGGSEYPTEVALCPMENPALLAPGRVECLTVQVGSTLGIHPTDVCRASIFSSRLSMSSAVTLNTDIKPMLVGVTLVAEPPVAIKVKHFGLTSPSTALQACAPPLEPLAQERWL
ncbi:hypothetical protein [Edaphobacter aggregans]|uniref:hypothetical protein n=1 Tax=Edaphobacter aggregans TaxID=570835 RepID=UPI0014700115|nr:hypothetical protein [Edaphobacter aggregans]